MEVYDLADAGQHVRQTIRYARYGEPITWHTTYWYTVEHAAADLDATLDADPSATFGYVFEARGERPFVYRRHKVRPGSWSGWTITVRSSDGRYRLPLGCGLDGDGRLVGTPISWPRLAQARAHADKLRAESVLVDGVGVSSGYYRVEPCPSRYDSTFARRAAAPLTQPREVV